MKYENKNKDGLRLCSTCGEWKKPEEFGAQTVRMKNGRIWTGLRPDCKDCHNSQIRKSRRLRRNEKCLVRKN